MISTYAQKVIKLGLSKETFKDVLNNEKMNKIIIIKFFNQDAIQFMKQQLSMLNVVIMAPLRNSSTKELIQAVKQMRVKNIIYIFCNFHTQT